MTRPEFPPNGKPRNHADEIANLRAGFHEEVHRTHIGVWPLVFVVAVLCWIALFAWLLS